MSTLSAYTIRFNSSKDYLKVSCIIYFLTAITLWCSSFFLGLKLILFSVLGIHLKKILKTARPYDFKELIYRENSWILLDKGGKQFNYVRIRLFCNTGLFFLLELINTESKKLIVVFHDQLCSEDYRLLKITEKINQS